MVHQFPQSLAGGIDILSFSVMKKALGNGRCIESDLAAAAGRSWRIAFYPNGRLPGTTDAVSVYLVMGDDGADDDVHHHVTFKFKLYEVCGDAPLVTYAHFVGGVFGRRAERALGLERFVTLEELERSWLLYDDCFAIGCEFTILSAWIDAPTTTPPPASALPEPDQVVAGAAPSASPPEPEPSSESPLHADLGRILKTKEGADVLFEVHGKVFTAHKLVLAARSPVFRAQFYGPTKEDTTTSSNHTLRIKDMDPETFEALLHYIYTDSLPPAIDAVMALDLLVAAARYSLQNLKSTAEGELCKHIGARRVFKMLEVAEAYRCSKLKEACLDFIGSRKNANAIPVNHDVEHLARRCPSVVKDVVAKVLDARKEDDFFISLCVLIVVFAITFGVLRCVFFSW
jgi:speckle-type POZ protein